jgi:pimeloyl-ACP methyl ester carboxylesterase
MPTLCCNGIDLHVVRAGQGPRLLYCNGSGATLAAVPWLLNRLAERFDVVAFDYRGMGASAPISEPYAMADAAADMAGLLDALGWEHTAMLGWSFGGMVAQEFAVSFPERLERLALLSTSPGGAFPSFRLDTLADLPPAQRAERSLQLMDQRWTPEWLAAHPADAALAKRIAGGESAGLSESQQRGWHFQLQARKDHDVLERLGKIACPTFVANGRSDGIAPVANGEAIVARVPRASLHSYAGGHAFFEQDASAWPDVIASLGG